MERVHAHVAVCGPEEGHVHHPGLHKPRKAIAAAFFITAAFMLVEAAGGLLTGSMALLRFKREDVAFCIVPQVAQLFIDRNRAMLYFSWVVGMGQPWYLYRFTAARRGPRPL
jgi:hypothetical protein